MARLLLLVLITQAASWAENSAAVPKPSSVPIPSNLTIEAYNLDTKLSWNYPVMAQKPVFVVQVKIYGEDEWLDACNTSDHHCNIFNISIQFPEYLLWARVKARLGQEESAYAQSEGFILCQHGKVGPPKLNISRKEDQIIINIFHPVIIVNGTELGSIFGDETCYTFKYHVYERINGSLIPERDVGDIESDCNETQCNFSIPVPSPKFEYCISAEGFSDSPFLKTEMSKEYCITISDSKRIKDSVWIAVVAAFILFLVIILVVLCWNFKKINPCKKESIILPKSLVSVVKSASSETKSELKYISPVIYEPIVPENEKVTWEEQLSPATISSMQTEDHSGKVNHRDLPSETQVGATEENTPDMAPDSPLTPIRSGDSVQSGSNQSETCIFALNSYHSKNGSGSGLMESGSCLSDSESSPSNKTGMKTGEPEPIMPRNTVSSFGYDKPHVLVDLPVDGGGKESLIGYRAPADSKEFP